MLQGGNTGCGLRKGDMFGDYVGRNKRVVPEDAGMKARVSVGVVLNVQFRLYVGGWLEYRADRDTAI